MIVEARDQITRADGAVTTSPSYWVLDGKPVEMTIVEGMFLVPETGETLIAVRRV
jgi:hypothetical protein